MKSLADSFSMNNGVEIPCVGFGTWQIPAGEIGVKSILEAIRCGYRHIDTAAAYHNERSVGEAVEACAVPRRELFITSKLWNSDQGYHNTLAAFEKSMSNLQLETLDLYLIHWPVPKDHRHDWQQSIADTWKAFEKLYLEGRIRAIGVSNFKTHHLQFLLSVANVRPMVNQIELHPGLNQDETVSFCRANDILVEAWAPLSKGRIFRVAEMKAIAEKHRRSVAQISLRWLLQKGILPLPKSITPERIAENGRLFDFDLLPEDVDFIDRLQNCEGSGLDPDWIDF